MITPPQQPLETKSSYTRPIQTETRSPSVQYDANKYFNSNSNAAFQQEKSEDKFKPMSYTRDTYNTYIPSSNNTYTNSSSNGYSNGYSMNGSTADTYSMKNQTVEKPSITSYQKPTGYDSEERKEKVT